MVDMRTWSLLVAALVVACDSDGDGVFGEASGSGSSSGGGVDLSTNSVTAQSSSADSGVGGGFTVSSNNVSATASSGSGSAGGGSETDCLPSGSDSTCMQCVKATCCAELGACIADFPCACVVGCLKKKQQNCYATCKTNFNHPPIAALTTCRSEKCGSDCIGNNWN